MPGEGGLKSDVRAMLGSSGPGRAMGATGLVSDTWREHSRLGGCEKGRRSQAEGTPPPFTLQGTRNFQNRGGGARGERTEGKVGDRIHLISAFIM